MVCCYLVLVFSCWLAIRTHAFGPVQWMKYPTRSLMLAPKGLPRHPENLASPLSLVLQELPDTVESFAANSDGTITWGSTSNIFCIDGCDKDERVVRLNRCKGVASQKWDVIRDSHGRSMIKLKGSNKCLDVVDKEGALDGLPIQLEDCDHAVAASWRFAAPRVASMRHVTVSIVALALSLCLLVVCWRSKTRLVARAQGSGLLRMVVDTDRTISKSLHLKTPKTLRHGNITMKLSDFHDGGATCGPAVSTHASAATLKIDKPGTHNHRTYEYMRLDNGMQVILASDPSCDKAAAALCMGVGRLHEAKETPGLAHFCEHMLFMGTEKFPDEEEYKRYVKGHGGTCNAYTDDAFTTYVFAVAPTFLSGALDRFSQFFVSPLFTPSATEREIDAVDSEHSMRITDDGRRSYATLLLDANPKHPLHWGSGNAHTLRVLPRQRGSDPHGEVVNFYKTHYSSEDMTLAVLGCESIEELKQIVNARFADVPATGRRALRGDAHGGEEPAIRAEDFSGLILRVPSRDKRHISFSWQLSQWQPPLWAVKPGEYSAFLLGHEGKGSLLSALKSNGWATALTAGVDEFGCFSQFDVGISLTESGLDHIQEVGVVVFTFIALLRSLPVQPWVLNEIQQLSEMGFRFADDMQPYSLVSTLVRSLQNYPPEHVLSGPSKLSVLDLDAAGTVLASLTADSVRVEVTAKRFTARCTSVDPWYNGQYTKLPLDEKWREAWFRASSSSSHNPVAEMEATKYGLSLPRPNPYIPTNLELRPIPPMPVSAEPVEIVPVPGVARSFHRQDDRFGQPKACLAFHFHSPDVASDAASFLRCQLWCEAVNEELTEYAYDAETAGLSYLLGAAQDGLLLSVAGFSDKLPELLRAVLRKMRGSSCISGNTYNIVHDRYERAMKNVAFKQRPCDLAARKLRELRRRIAFPVEERLPLLQAMTFSDLNGESERLLGEARIEALLMGNIDKSDAAAIASMINEELSTRDASAQLPTQAEAALPEGYTVWKISGTNSEERNHAVRLEIQIPTTLRNTVNTSLLVRILSAKFFDELRTKQQLGYIVQMSWFEGYGFLGISCTVQSEYDPEYVRSRVDAFFEEYLRWVEVELDEVEFSRQRDGLVSNMAEAPKNLGEEFQRHWNEISLQRYGFGRREANRRALEIADLRGLQGYVRDLVRAAPRLYVEVHSTSQNVSKVGSEAKGGIVIPDRIWAEEEAAHNFRASARFVANDWCVEELVELERLRQ